MAIKAIVFRPYGPYVLHRDANLITGSTLKKLWNKASGVADGIGVYIIATRERDSLLPWYVGKTDKGFQKRFYQHSRSKKHIFAKISQQLPGEEIVVMFLARETERGKIKSARKPSAQTKTKSVATIRRLEYDILTKALDKNPELFNVSNRMYRQMLRVPGLTDNPKSEVGPPKDLRALLERN